MKKTIKAALISLVLTLSLTVGVLFAACASDPVVFDYSTEVMGFATDITVTLSNEDDTFTVVSKINGDLKDETKAQFQAIIDRTGTYTFENNVYTLTFSKAVNNYDSEEATTTVKTVYDESAKTHTLKFKIVGRDSTIKFESTIKA